MVKNAMCLLYSSNLTWQTGKLLILSLFIVLIGVFEAGSQGRGGKEEKVGLMAEKGQNREKQTKQKG
jgi:hypothetical protein